VPANHPVKLIKQLAGAALKELSPRFEQMYSEVGRPSIPPERLLKASLFDGAVHVRSERMFREQLDYNLFFCWPWILTGTSRASPPALAVFAGGCWGTRWRASFSALWRRKRGSQS
jgi:hypothetical protein